MKGFMPASVQGHSDGSPTVALPFAGVKMILRLVVVPMGDGPAAFAAGLQRGFLFRL